MNVLREQKNCSIYIYTTIMDKLTLEKAKKSINDRFGFDMNSDDNVDVVQFVHIRFVF